MVLGKPFKAWLQLDSHARDTCSRPLICRPTCRPDDELAGSLLKHSQIICKKDATLIILRARPQRATYL